MTELTIVAVPKPFTDLHTETIQRNALASWAALRAHAEVEILVFGSDFGVSDVCVEFGVEHIPDVECSPLGTPLLSSIFSIAFERSASKIICYTNFDILLFEDLLSTIRLISFPDFLAVGQRTNVDVADTLDFSSPSACEATRTRLMVTGKLMGKSANDYFAFSKWLLKEPIPPLSVGRPQWDSWFIYNAVRRGFTIVDTSVSCTALHQNHGYGHVPRARGNRWEGLEGDDNTSLVQEDLHRRTTFTMKDADWVVKNGALKRARGPEYMLSKVMHLDFRYRWLSPIYSGLRSLLITLLSTFRRRGV